MASLRHLARGAAAPRALAGLSYRGFASASNAGGQRPGVFPPKPPPGASAGAPGAPAKPPVVLAKPSPTTTPAAPPSPAAKPGPATTLQASLAATAKPAAQASPATRAVAQPAPAATPVATAKPLGSSAPAAAASSKPEALAATKAASSKPAASSRDPERPKRPASAWLRYLADFRKQNASLKGTEVMKAAAAKWKVLSAEQRKPYETPYEAEKKVYDKAFAEYVASGKRDAWIRDPEKPKRPLTAFLRFSGEYRAKNPTLKMTEASQKAGAVWKSMTNGAKASYQQKYTAEKAEYDKLIKEYQDSGKEAAYKAKKGPTVAETKKVKADAKKEKEKEKKLKLKAAADKKKEKEAAKKLKLKEKEAAKKEKEAAKKEKEAAKKLKEKEAVKNLKAKEGATGQKAEKGAANKSVAGA